ncbi:PAQR-type receptor KNAG_0M01240 [Huiozyma naganishii CBS 8797]|uniref:Uncharacterized protein n=1 Tax=Huiozyma naganishii (strain ATCC MYA-139 / BCRC 22969 / CBS 8797 / KCTC 17520 / NBRC 10181 / NCYC 3082 / Yp74L-3) TaxID=1071383 RepID=J7S447_HUIN7|nr:hypothetical protein KNAG_0M01240 [Kazachstania naganishii CBS 8797]CCK72977.1 hypothetical protein KNAG_0M01240 [Kazachstania naganishii CBS 8797]
MSSRVQRQTVTITEPVVYEDDGGEMKTATKKITKRIYTWNEIPEWQKDNEHIIDGYVRETNSFLKCVHSLFYLHNESVNVYSHLIPALCFFSVLFLNKYCVKSFETTSLVDYLFIDLFFLGAFTCLILSSTFHCFKSHSLKVATFGNKLDYLGIVVLIVTSMISILYYGFYDSSVMFYFFSFVTLSFGTACGVVSLKDHFRSREWRPYRAGLFVAFGLSAILPILSGMFAYGIEEAFHRIQIKWIILEGVFYILGAFLYGIRFPEKGSPGKYDIWGHSHQVFHILVVVAALCHLKGLMVSYELVHKGLSSATKA